MCIGVVFEKYYLSNTHVRNIKNKSAAGDDAV